MTEAVKKDPGGVIRGIAVHLTTEMIRANAPGLTVPTDVAKAVIDIDKALTAHWLGGEAGAEAHGPNHAKTKPEIKASIHPDHLTSFEDGKRYKSLKRHLTGRGLTPQAYQTKYGLPADYPMVAPNYAKQRSELAKQMGLGKGRAKA